MNNQSVSDPATPPVGRVWTFWATLLWGVATCVALGLAQIAASAAILAWRLQSFDASDLPRLSSDGLAVALAALAVAPATLAVVALAIRLARADFAEYLALRWFGRRDLLRGLGCIAAYVAAVDLLARLTGRSIEPPFVLDTLRSAAAAGALPLFIVAVVIAAPLSEELAVRGFLFRGFAASSLGPAGAILLTSAMWASLHLQYDAFFIGEVFGVGLILGWMRWRSDSTWLAVVLHGAYNLIAVAQGLWLLM
jgi:uncharacterized protein